MNEDWDMHEVIEDLANKTIEGYFKNGQERKDILGWLYPFVQNRVNEKLGCSKRYPYW